MKRVKNDFEFPMDEVVELVMAEVRKKHPDISRDSRVQWKIDEMDDVMRIVVTDPA